MNKRNKKIKNFHVNYDRMDLVEDRLNGPAADFGVTAVGVHKASELLAMACEDIYPDGSYSDYECGVWEMFRAVLRAEGLL